MPIRVKEPAPSVNNRLRSTDLKQETVLAKPDVKSLPPNVKPPPFDAKLLLTDAKHRLKDALLAYDTLLPTRRVLL